VPSGVKGQLTAKLTYDTAPFKVTCKDKTFTVR